MIDFLTKSDADKLYAPSKAWIGDFVCIYAPLLVVLFASIAKLEKSVQDIEERIEKLSAEVAKSPQREGK